MRRRCDARGLPPQALALLLGYSQHCPVGLPLLQLSGPSEGPGDALGMSFWFGPATLEAVACGGREGRVVSRRAGWCPILLRLPSKATMAGAHRATGV